MRGKVTFRDGLHHSRTGGWIEPVSIGNGEWRELESALGSLDVSARNNIEESGKKQEYLPLTFA